MMMLEGPPQSAEYEGVWLATAVMGTHLSQYPRLYNEQESVGLRMSLRKSSAKRPSVSGTPRAIKGNSQPRW